MSNATVEDPTDVIEPKSETLVTVLGEGDDQITFVQKPLTFFGKLEFFSVAGGAIEKALSDGVSISELLEGPARTEGTPLTTDSLKEADTFVKAITHLVQFAPEILLDLYCVILAVPRGEREYVKYRLENELTDDQGFAILDRFIDQNWEVLVGFFSERILPLVTKVTSKVQGSAPSKPSKATRRSTPKP